MDWTERIKLAWKIFKREALPLYAWTLIYIGIGVVVMIALVIGAVAQLGWAFPHLSQSFGGYSPDMPIPGVPPAYGDSPFGPFNGSFGRLSILLSLLKNVAGTLFLMIVIAWLLGTAFYTGLYNLTAKAYQEPVTFKDFSYSGFFRLLGWQGMLLLIKIFIVLVGVIGAIILRNSYGGLIVFLLVYALFLIIVVVYALPWLAVSGIYLLAHRQNNFSKALSDSWKFFRNHMGILWGYIGTVALIEIGVQILNRIVSGLGGLLSLIVSPFIAVLAIVWVLSLEDKGIAGTSPTLTPTDTYVPPSDYTQTEEPTSATPADTNVSDGIPLPSTTPFPTPDNTISLQKTESPAQPVSEAPSEEVPEHQPSDTNERPNFCPSCGKANTGTAYCPQCGTKL
ncbi:hypothetical protein Desaci_0535 [Desulfosporosinus acidiphilus SJ4]|uniref:Zinc-ribbon domain-containing protein n=1 Tax=Desulfosporosinus acidiphilus (strain DSM 22704 / JCM 16185 / SJ4) TaxID=646529 RepID=I4D1C7_DESAJ|nr:hypothetical protein [Desulfosporosinus acidiphilus]AFM39601.1 hypothetical protein Desaci_0535 [Desulfosporosinus acidiphilus SJ4]